MKNKKRLALLSVILIFSLIVSACGTVTTPGVGEASEPNINDGVVYDETTIIFSHGAPVNDARNIGALAFKEYVEETSKGKVKVDVYPAGQLGDGRTSVEAVQNGGIQIYLCPPANVAGFDPLLAITDVPYLFPGDFEKAKQIVKGPAGQAILDTMEDYGMIGLSFWMDMYKAFTANKPLLSPDDINGLKFRVMSSPVLIKMIESWGGHPLVIDYQETFTALQTGAIDGQEAGVGAGIYGMKFYEVQEYLMLTNHILGLQMIFTNKDWFESLNQDTQKLIRDGMEVGFEVHLKERTKTEEVALKAIKDYGTNVIDLSEVQMQVLSDTAKQQCMDYFIEANGDKAKELVDILTKEIAKISN